MGIGKGTGRGGPRRNSGGARPGSGRKKADFTTVNLTLYLREYENDAAHFLAVDRGVPISRCIGDIIMEAYYRRVSKGE